MARRSRPTSRARPDAAETRPDDQRRLVESLLRMYRDGWFPMWQEEDDEVRWVQPAERGVIPIDERFVVSRSLRARVRSGRFVVTTDRAFGRVIRACGEPAKGREQTWLHPAIVRAFDLLHEAGHAHSVEAWLPRPRAATDVAPDTGPPECATELDRTHELVGGLYGLALGRVFSGESMFSRPALGGTDASKVCLVRLVEHLRARGFVMLDAQLSNEHLVRFGLYEIPRERYLATLAEHGERDIAWQPFGSEAGPIGQGVRQG